LAGEKDFTIIWLDQNGFTSVGSDEGDFESLGCSDVLVGLVAEKEPAECTADGTEC
jgi:hypothetical protein